MSETFKNRFQNFIRPENYRDRMHLPPGCGGPCQIWITGKSMVSLDGCKGLLDYKEDHITLRACDGVYTIYGKKLSMKTFSSHHIAICGEIHGILEGVFRKEVILADH